MSKNTADALGHGLEDMEGVVDIVPYSTTFDNGVLKQEQQQVMPGGGEICWLDEKEEEDNNLLDVNDASLFYSDFPPLPDFPCMSSSSSSSSTPTSTKLFAAKSSSSSASSSSSSSAVSWTVMKPVQTEGTGDKRRRQYDHHSADDSPSPAAALLSTASMEVLPQDGSDDVDCINALENFGYMDLIDNNDIWDPSSIFQFDNNEQEIPEQKSTNFQQKAAAASQLDQTQQSEDQLFFLQGNSELAGIFLEWLKQNRDYISAEEMRNIKLKRSTIECASKRLGTSEEGKKQLLKLVLEWVEQYQLQRKRMKEDVPPDSPYHHYQEPPPPPPAQSIAKPTSNSDDFNNVCFSPSPNWVPAPPVPPPFESGAALVAPAFTPANLGFICDPNYPNIGPSADGSGPNQMMNGNFYPPAPSEYQQSMDAHSPQAWNAPPPFSVAPQYDTPYTDNGSGGIPNALYGNPYPYQVFDGSTAGGGDQRLRLGSSATKEARKKRMARQRRLSIHQYRHNNHQNQAQIMNQGGVDQQQQHGRSSVENNCTSSQANNANSWVYWSPAPPSSSTVPDLVSPTDAPPNLHTHHYPADRSHIQQQRQASSDRRQGYKTEKNLKFLLQKVLKQSDVGNLGRIVLPKKEAETHLPELESRDGIPIAMEDIGTSNVWNMRYRFWPNNKSRMYLLENTGDFVRVNGLQEGDFIVIYSDTKCGKYLIRGIKVRQPGSKSEGKKPARRNMRNLTQAGANDFSQLAPSFKQTVK